MKTERAIELLGGLLDNALELKESEYSEVFAIAISAIGDVDSMTKLMKTEEKMLIEEFGEEWYKEHATKVATETFKMKVEEMDDCDFKKFVVEHMDEITGSSFEEMRLS